MKSINEKRKKERNWSYLVDRGSRQVNGSRGSGLFGVVRRGGHYPGVDLGVLGEIGVLFKGEMENGKYREG